MTPSGEEGKAFVSRIRKVFPVSPTNPTREVWMELARRIRALRDCDVPSALGEVMIGTIEDGVDFDAEVNLCDTLEFLDISGDAWDRDCFSTEEWAEISESLKVRHGIVAAWSRDQCCVIAEWLRLVANECSPLSEDVVKSAFAYWSSRCNNCE